VWSNPDPLSERISRYLDY